MQLSKNNRVQLLLVLTILSLAFSACSVRLIAPYDAVTDEEVYSIQEKVLLQFAEWNHDIASYEENSTFYDEVDVKLTILIERNKQIPKSDFIVGMLERIRTNIVVEVKQLHQNDLLDNEVIEQIKPDIMSQFIAIQKFQMALKRNETVNSSNED